MRGKCFSSDGVMICVCTGVLKKYPEQEDSQRKMWKPRKTVLLLLLYVIMCLSTLCVILRVF